MPLQSMLCRRLSRHGDELSAVALRRCCRHAATASLATYAMTVATAPTRSSGNQRPVAPTTR